MRTIIVCSAVAANVEKSLWQGKIIYREIRGNGSIKTLWTKRTGQRLARLSKHDALADAIHKAQEIIDTTSSVDIKLVVTPL
jgi:hypothetical protein